MDNVSETIKSFEELIEKARKSFDKNRERKALNSLGLLYHAVAKYEEAELHFRKSLLVATEIRNKNGEGMAYSNLGAVYQSVGKHDEAIKCFEKCLSIAIEMGDKNSEAITYGKLKAIYRSLGKDEEREFYEKRLSIAVEIGDKIGERREYGNLGEVYQSLGKYEKAIECFEKCLTIAIEIGDKQGEGAAYAYLGFTYDLLGKYENAIKFLKKGLSIAIDTGDKSGEGRSYGNLGVVYRSLGKYEEAIKFYEKFLTIAIEIGDKDGEGTAYGNLGVVYRSLGKYEEAVTFYKKCLSIAIDIGDKIGEGRAYGNLGAVHHSLGKYEDAINFYEKCLSITSEIGDKKGEGTVCGELGITNQSLGRYAKAIKFYEQCLRIAVEIGDKNGKGTAYGNLGALYEKLGKYEEARKFHEKRLSIAIEIGDKNGKGTAYGNLGAVYHSLGKYEQAIKFHEKCLSIAIEIGDKNGEGTANGNLGAVYHSLEKNEQAIKFYEKSLSIAVAIGDKNSQGRAYGNLGKTYQSLGKYEETIKMYKKCLSIAIEVGDKASEGVTLHNLGHLHLALNGENQHENMKKAVCYFEDALQCFELIFDDLESYDKFKISILDTFITTYHQLIQVLIDLNQKDRALLVSERARARALDDLLVSKYSMNQRNVCRSKVNAPEDIQSIVEEKKFRIIFFALNSDYVASWLLAENKPLVFHRKEIKPTKTVTCQENESLEEVVKQAFHEMGVRAMVHCEDRSLDNLEVNYESGDGAPLLLEDEETKFGPYERKVSDMNVGVRCIEPPDEENGRDCLEVLYEMLIAPVKESLIQDEIVLVPDGALFQVPFAALRDPTTKAFLSETKRIRIAPSLTALRALQDSPADYHMKTGALVIGNPAVWEVMVEGEKKKFCFLPGAELEAKEISSLLGVKPLTGDKATKKDILLTLQDGVGVVHIATHASAKGQILLAPSLSVRGVPDVKDCMLTMDEIQEVGLRAQLVVLSCCHTGRGEIRAEGVVGLTRAFLAAGARAVVASLWAIDDEATKVFMVHFYSHLKRGESASVSLQQAMKEMRKNPCYSEPRYWAAFFLVGDDVTIGQFHTQEG